MHFLKEVIALWTPESPHNYDIFDCSEHKSSLWYVPKMKKNSLFLNKLKAFFHKWAIFNDPRRIYLYHKWCAHSQLYCQVIGWSLWQLLPYMAAVRLPWRWWGSSGRWREGEILGLPRAWNIICDTFNITLHLISTYTNILPTLPLNCIALIAENRDFSTYFHIWKRNFLIWQ